MASLIESFLWDEAQDAAQRMTKTYGVYRQGMSDQATPRRAHKNSL